MAAIIFNRNISHEAHDRMRRLGTKDLRVVAFHPGGGWTIVNAANQFFARGIPDECYQKMLELSGNGHQIRCVAFPTEGGNRWSLASDGQDIL